MSAIDRRATACSPTRPTAVDDMRLKAVTSSPISSLEVTRIGSISGSSASTSARIDDDHARKLDGGDFTASLGDPLQRSTDRAVQAVDEQHHRRRQEREHEQRGAALFRASFSAALTASVSSPKSTSTAPISSWSAAEVGADDGGDVDGRRFADFLGQHLVGPRRRFAR